MKFYELKKGQAFRFVNDSGVGINQIYISAGVDGMYGRCVHKGKNWRDTEEWQYCSPLAWVESKKELNNE